MASVVMLVSPFTQVGNQKLFQEAVLLHWRNELEQTPILFLPSRYDPEAKVDSSYVQQLAEQRKVSPEEISIEFPKMIHGWVTRGDDSNEEVTHGIEQALQLAVKFIKDFKV